MYKKIRRILAVLFCVGLTLLFLDFTGTLHRWLDFMAKVQLMPAVLSINVSVIIGLALLTFLLGRVYCSVICPLGVLQDFVSWLRGRLNKKKLNRFGYSPERRWLRYPILIIFIAAIVAGIGSLVALLDPYGAYGRFATGLLQPLWQCGNNGLAAIAEHYESYAFYKSEVWLRSLPVLLITVCLTALVIVLAWRGGRTYCNTVCPVGTMLGLLSRFSLFRFTINNDKCISCGACAQWCKASCIDFHNHSIDYSRCVACGDCVSNCSTSAIALRPVWSKSADASESDKPISVDKGKRAFLIGSAVALSGAALAQTKKKRDGGLAVIEDKKIPERKTPITPPGSLSARNMARHCTACQLCVAECPNQVLRPSDDLMTLMQPVLSYERGNFCRPECVRCSQVCPTGAIRPITIAEKSSLQIGHAVWVMEHCLPLNDKTEDGLPIACGNCARHCPAGAIRMVPMGDGDDAPLIPVINEERCIGCGACESVCPARPFTAIYVEGHDTHRSI